METTIFKDEHICITSDTDRQYYIKHRGPHLGLYCANCNAWIKWINKYQVMEYLPYCIVQGIYSEDMNIIEEYIPYNETEVY